MGSSLMSPRFTNHPLQEDLLQAFCSLVNNYDRKNKQEFELMSKLTLAGDVDQDAGGQEDQDQGGAAVGDNDRFRST